MENYNILIVDDEESVISAYQKILSPNYDEGQNQLDSLASELFDQLEQPEQRQTKTSFKVKSTTQGLTAVEMVKTALNEAKDFTVAFIDMRMPPGIDGLETAKRILAVDPRMEIVIVTAYTDISRDEIARVLGKHRFFYLKKPFDFDEVWQLAESLTFRWNLERSREQLEKEKEVFMSNMSHELRHPLQIILGFCDTMLNYELDKNKQKEFITNIQTEAFRLKKLVVNLKESKELKQATKIEFENFDLAELGKRVISLLSGEADKKGLELKSKIDSNLKSARGNQDSIVQVLINLIVNAIQYTEEGQVNLIIEQTETEALIQIQDTGVGISKSDQELIFQRFYRVESEAKKVRGHGLGLEIASEILKQHDSTLNLTSVPGEGSTFSFKLPLV